jgi:hypothetical protein
MNNTHLTAWLNLKETIRKGKTSWGKNELLTLMSDILDKAYIEVINELQQKN